LPPKEVRVRFVLLAGFQLRFRTVGVHTGTNAAPDFYYTTYQYGGTTTLQKRVGTTQGSVSRMYGCSQETRNSHTTGTKNQGRKQHKNTTPSSVRSANTFNNTDEDTFTFATRHSPRYNLSPQRNDLCTRTRRRRAGPTLASRNGPRKGLDTQRNIRGWLWWLRMREKAHTAAAPSRSAPSTNLRLQTMSLGQTSSQSQADLGLPQTAQTSRVCVAEPSYLPRLKTRCTSSTTNKTHKKPRVHHAQTAETYSFSPSYLLFSPSTCTSFMFFPVCCFFLSATRRKKTPTCDAAAKPWVSKFSPFRPSSRSRKNVRDKQADSERANTKQGRLEKRMVGHRGSWPTDGGGNIDNENETPETKMTCCPRTPSLQWDGGLQWEGRGAGVPTKHGERTYLRTSSGSRNAGQQEPS